MDNRTIRWYTKYYLGKRAHLRKKAGSSKFVEMSYQICTIQTKIDTLWNYFGHKAVFFLFEYKNGFNYFQIAKRSGLKQIQYKITKFSYYISKYLVNSKFVHWANLSMRIRKNSC